MNSEKTVIEELVKILWKRREELYNADGNDNSISWIDEDMDHLEIGFLKQEPDSGYSHELKDRGYSLTFLEALELASTRLNNSGYEN